MKRHDLIGARRHPNRESGQATTEFALILFPLLLLVAGIIQFGIGLNYWLDMQRIANQGARWAAVNNWPPDCPRGSSSCSSPNTLQETLERQVLTAGLESAINIEVCYPATTKNAGDPVKVHLEAPFTFLPILGIGTITLGADATMRLESSQEPALGGLITNEVLPTC
ncbi:MAG: pilus assembly protein [Thermoleophilia bacterium]|nr:pilus assembly protein [Thermoleophilia bacterium]MDH4339852.1 pilus assembly protein [Thermoleophilia bacterium]MDH5281135.1 pilus assembly protein [Thermoleophilia bacterium]